MNNSIKTLFIVGIGVVGACAILVKVIQNNKTKIMACLQVAKEVWEKNEAPTDSTLHDEVKPNV